MLVSNMKKIGDLGDFRSKEKFPFRDDDFVVRQCKATAKAVYEWAEQKPQHPVG